MAIFTDSIEVTIDDLYAVATTNVSPISLMDKIPQAVSVIETVTGVFFNADFRDVEISTRDAAWLKRAAAYQLAFMLEQNGLTSRQSVTSLSQDGLSVNAPDELTFVLAPLAKRALANTSWSRSGTTPVKIDKTRTAFDPTVSDDHAWYPLGGV